MVRALYFMGDRMTLTPREQQVAAMLGAGMRPKDICAALGISKNAVSSYQIRAQEKLELYSRHQLAAWARNTAARDRDSGAAVASVAYRGVTTDKESTTTVGGHANHGSTQQNAPGGGS